MGQKRTFRDLILGVLKDKASLSKAVVLSKRNTTFLHLAILRATTHQPSSLPNENHIKVILDFGNSSPIIASTCIEALMNRLHKTHSSVVAFKCLITIHTIMRRGSFILQDQLFIYPATGGKNYLNLSNFRHNSTPDTWNLSSWVRWYARVQDSLILTSRILGFFFSQKRIEGENISGILTPVLLKEIDVLVSLVEEVCSAPEIIINKNIVYEALCLVRQDCTSAQNELFIRIGELKTRIDSLTFAGSVELVCVVKRLENCKERMLILFLDKKGSIGDRLWCSLKEMKEMIEERKAYDERRSVTIGRRVGISESARFGERVILSNNSLQFSSGRLKFDWVPVMTSELVQ